MSFDVGRGERLLVMGLNGAGQDDAAEGARRAPRAPTSARSTLGTNVSLGYYAQEHEGIRAGRTLLDHMREASPTSATRELRALLGMFGADRRRRRSRTRPRSRAARRRSSRSRSSSPGATTCCSSTSRPTTSTRRARTATGAALAAWPGTMIVVSHDVEFVQALAPDRVLLMPEGTLDYFDDAMLEFVELA